MSQDEACRRIELARLARKFPALFVELESGRITLSVALLLKPVLSPSNHLELLSAARGKSIRQARELLAERLPKADAPSSIRKLPERRPQRALDRPEVGSPEPASAGFAPLPSPATIARASSLLPADLQAASPPRPGLPPPCLPVPTLVSPLSEPLHEETRSVPTPLVLMPPLSAPSSVPLRPTVSSSAAEAPARSLASRDGSAQPSSRSCIEPLSPRRYRIQFTADAALKQKLEQARDLLRHAHPSGDFGPIVARALDLIIDDLLRRRFGAAAHPKVPNPASPKAAPVPSAGARSKASSSSTVAHTPASEAASTASATTLSSASRKPRSSHVPRAARRAVLERDGLGCSWLDAHGVRCGSQAWLELDHGQPAGKGGSSEADNLRLLCRAHNRLAAEHAYGREHIERTSKWSRETESRFALPHEGNPGVRHSSKHDAGSRSAQR